jgi:hypothetical protein
MITNDVLFKTLMVEDNTKLLVLKGITDWKLLTEEINNSFHPTTVEEMELYSEAIIYARCSILN